MNILDSTQYIITIPTDPEELATLLDNCAHDWGVVLNFLATVSNRNGIQLEVGTISRIMIDKYKEF